MRVATRTRAGRASGWLALLLAISGMATLATPAHASPTVLYDQTDNLFFTKISSTNNSTTPANTTQVADDFSVPAGQHWAISEVDVDGEFTGSPIGSVNAFLYANAGSLPGAQLFAQSNIVASGPNYAVALTGAPVLGPGTYWISIQANGSGPNYWHWQTRSVQSGNPSALQNPGGAVLPGCATWGVTSTCIVAMGVYDQAFKLLGVDQHLLTVSETGTGGSVKSVPAGVDCGLTCSTTFDAGTVVTLTATAATGASFTGWGGDCSGTGTCLLTMSADHTVSATFGTAAPGAPNTRITQATIDSGKGVATFRFRAVGDATDFRCKLTRGHDEASFKRCRSPKTYTKLKRGTYVFQVKAFGPSGNDPTPAKKRFKID